MDIPSDPSDMAIVAAIIAMAHKLNLSVVAEGVETIEQLTFLCDNLCDGAQGYLFSRPLFFEQLEHYLQNHDPKALRDRKSTRLNSSHVRISYAVFCLKKKKNIKKQKNILNKIIN